MPVHLVFGYTQDIQDTRIVFGSEIIGIIDGQGKNIDLSIFRGDTHTYEVHVRDIKNNIISLDGVSIWFTVRDETRLQENDDVNILFQRKNITAGGSDDQVFIYDSDKGIFYIYVIPNNTQDIPFGEYEYDIQIKLSNGEIYTINRGKFILLSETTRSQ